MARDTINGWQPQSPLYDMSIPSLHSPPTGQIVPSTFTTATFLKESGCFSHIFFADIVFDVRKRANLFFVEPAQEVPGRSRVRNRFRPDRVQPGVVVPERLDVLQARASRQDVVCDVEYVVGFAIWKMAFRKVEIFVDLPLKTAFLYQLADGADAPRF